MPWVKVPLENHPIFRAALPDDKRVETMQMFGGVAAKVGGNIFAGLFGRSAMVLLNERDRAAALALEGAAMFDPMGNGRVRSDKVMLPESMMRNPKELRSWIRKAFDAAATLPMKVAKSSRGPGKKQGAAKAKPAAGRAVAKAGRAKKR